MPRNYKPTMKPYTEMSLELALSEIESGESIRATAAKYNFSRSILTKHISVKAGTAVLQARGRKPILSQTVEDCFRRLHPKDGATWLWANTRGNA